MRTSTNPATLSVFGTLREVVTNITGFLAKDGAQQFLLRWLWFTLAGHLAQQDVADST